MHLPRLKKLYEATYPTDVTRPPSSLSLGKHISKNEMEDYFKQYIPKLRKVGIDVPDNPRFLGGGAMGYAYDIGSTVLKITNDRSEANACVRILGKKLENVYEIYDVYELDSLNIFAIHQEKLQPLDEEIKDKWISVKEALELKQRKPSIGPDGMFEAFKTAFYIHNDYNRALKVPPPELVDALYDINHGLEELKTNGIKFVDYHANNIMKRGEAYVIIDLGVSKSGERPIDKID